MWMDFLAALALVMVIEGLLPALSPLIYRKAMLAMSQMDERSLRITGLVSMVAGAVFLYLIKN
ncbi:MAG: DUF2065 domain-containing protein [Gammaproteobacteria bacterium]|nr:DUF2065 domain-containing protein [Gammaproteobacteria bacterium]MCW8839828.1 DUF2065 domain-containing protein [Gammaproteobacteria bacterium]MCW8928327.1 DUF2065 domain-containing protein [Gammaproteobacteria bacterium]MCW8959588.1 DUF2065 domain-containing protein [Gammaproteobacteria bacterium]MCW8971830.1 DUF2065 domain-containing protein [Gammaproteobacteria bacterium]